MSQTTLTTTAQQPTNAHQGSNQPDQAPSAGDWTLQLTIGLSYLIGILFARHVVAAVWPGLDAFWGTFVTNIVVACAAGLIVKFSISLFKRARKR